MSNKENQERALSEDEKHAAWKRLKPVHYKVGQIGHGDRATLTLSKGFRKRAWHGLSVKTVWEQIVSNAACLPFNIERELLRQHYPLRFWEMHRFTKSLRLQDVITVYPMREAGYAWWEVPPIVVDITEVSPQMRSFHDGNYRNEQGERGKKQTGVSELPSLTDRHDAEMTKDAKASMESRTARTNPHEPSPEKVSKFAKDKGDPKDGKSIRTNTTRNRGKTPSKVKEQPVKMGSDSSKDYLNDKPKPAKTPVKRQPRKKKPDTEK